jgi:hypothetical protein
VSLVLVELSPIALGPRRTKRDHVEREDAARAASEQL